MLIHASIPSPPQGVWHLGPVPIRAYALCIILGVVVAVWLGNRRWIARGGRPGTVADIAVWAVPFGLVGARLYHVITDYELYFGADRDPLKAFAVWEGGLGIWGGIALGAVGAWIGCRRRGIPLAAMADALAPGIVLAQAIGRWGNWFNQELFGAPTKLPWGLHIDPEHRPAGYEQSTTFQPTFLYECVWNVGVAGLVIWADRKFRLGHGRAFALYVAAYTLGRGWIEYLRIDPVNHIAGLRLNVWTSIIVFLAAVAYFVVSARLWPGREEVVEPVDQEAADGESASASGLSSASDASGVSTGSSATTGSSAAAGPAGSAGTGQPRGKSGPDDTPDSGVMTRAAESAQPTRTLGGGPDDGPLSAST